MKLNNHNVIFYHVYQVTMYTLGLLILIAYETWKNVH